MILLPLLWSYATEIKGMSQRGDYEIPEGNRYTF